MATLSSFIKSSKGLYQGDPLSRMLIIILMEAPSKIMKQVVRSDYISSFTMGDSHNNLLMISYLLFVDDTFIFCDTNSNQI